MSTPINLNTYYRAASSSQGNFSGPCQMQPHMPQRSPSMSTDAAFQTHPHTMSPAHHTPAAFQALTGAIVHYTIQDAFLSEVYFWPTSDNAVMYLMSQIYMKKRGWTNILDHPPRHIPDSVDLTDEERGDIYARYMLGLKNTLFEDFQQEFCTTDNTGQIKWAPVVQEALDWAVMVMWREFRAPSPLVVAEHILSKAFPSHRSTTRLNSKSAAAPTTPALIPAKITQQFASPAASRAQLLQEHQTQPQQPVTAAPTPPLTPATTQLVSSQKRKRGVETLPEERSAKVPRVTIDLTLEAETTSGLPLTPSEDAPVPELYGFQHSAAFCAMMDYRQQDPIAKRLREKWASFANHKRHAQVDLIFGA